MDWNNFSFDYHLEVGDLFRDLVSIEASKEASLNLIVPPDWQNQLDKLNRVRAVHGTTALEGNPLSEAEVSEQIDSLEKQMGNEGNKLSREQLQIRNAGFAQAWVKERFYPGNPSLTLEDLMYMHEIVTRDSDEIRNIPGTIHNFSVTVGSPEVGGVHRGAPYERLPSLIKQYIEFINSRKFEANHPVIKALLAHFFLVTIHPFGDGNGRVSRVVEAGLLFRDKYNVHGFYGLSNYFYRNEREYKTVLQECRKDQPFDVTPFIRFGIVGFASELKGINNFLKARINRIVYRDTLVRAFSKRVKAQRRLINQREYNLLDFLVTETQPLDPFSDNPSRQIKLKDLYTLRYIQSVYENVTWRTFVREILRLSELGFIIFTQDKAAKDWIVELDFGAIAKY